MLTWEQLRRLLRYIEQEREFPEADILKILLSFLAALRACEISGLTIADVTNADGSISDTIRLPANITKGGRAREVPIHPDLAEAIVAFRNRYPGCEWLAISQVKSRVRHQSPNAVTIFFAKLYKACGFEGCSSHSGRRTFITHTCRNLPPDCSIRDVQLMVGHRRLDTTQSYIVASPNQAAVVKAMGSYVRRGRGAY